MKGFLMLGAVSVASFVLAGELVAPSLTWCEPPARANGGCMILVSDGMDPSSPWCGELTKLGFQCVAFAARRPLSDDAAAAASAWADAQRAVRLVRAAAKERGFDSEKIGVIGASAGACLAVRLATSSLSPAYAPFDDLDRLPCHVNWALAHAPAGKDAFSGFGFDAKTCPVCFLQDVEDPYATAIATRCYRAFRKRKVPAELHLYADRGAGAFGFDRAVEFMRQMGYLGELEEPVQLDHRFHPDATVRTEKEYLWPRGAMPSAQANQEYAPYLVWYIPERPTTKAIQVVLAGGGYSFCNYVGEAEPVAYYLNQKGMTVVCVKYRCPRPLAGPKHLTAWQDAQRAIRLVRREAPVRGLDPDRIGTMGFSAGGHLTLMTALSSGTNAYEPVDDADRLPCTVQWSCPIYPAYALTDGVNKPNANGGNPDDAVPVPEFAFDAGTPPMCFMHGDADVWAAMNSVKCWERLRAMGISCDLHTLATRGHCFQIKASPGTGSYTWLDRIWDFLSRKNFNR